MDLEVNGKPVTLECLDDLLHALAQVSRTDLSEVDLQVDEELDVSTGFFGLIVMVSGARAFLTYFRYYADTALNSWDPDYTGPVDAELAFRFSNGEVDPYPVWWTVDTDRAFDAVVYTYLNRAPAPFIAWREAEEMSQFS